MFKDNIRLNFQAGKGGDGKASLGKNKHPDGGMGGDGGNIYIEGTTNLFDFRTFTQDKIYKAQDGQPGGQNNKTGRSGKDLIVKLPLASVIYDTNGKILCTINQDKQKKVLVKGGRGGVGNHFYRSSGLKNLWKFKKGQPGEKINTYTELELISDIIFLGLPNVGKSSILDQLSDAKPKIADYAFTTIAPQIGMAGSIALMDLPGLIEGTFEGKGLGSGFIKHTRHTKIIAHFISLQSENIFKDYEIVRKEIQKIDEKLFCKPEILVLTKSDEVKPQILKKILSDLKGYFTCQKIKPVRILPVSVLDDESMKILLNEFKQQLRKLLLS